MSDDKVGELEAEIAGQKLTLKDAPLNTIATVATLLLVGGLIVGGYFHVQASEKGQSEIAQAMKESSQAAIAVSKEHIATIREATQAQRESNCLIRFDQKERQQQAQFCRDVAR